jgi:DNA-binding CsgD family transcriptional regulator
LRRTTNALQAAPARLYPRQMAESPSDQAEPVRASADPTQVELLERDAELAALDAAVEAVAGGAGCVVAIEGAAGIGKTSLLRRARERAADRGFRVLAGRGSELEQTFPFGLVRQLFEPVVARTTRDDRDSLFDGAAGLARPLLDAGHLDGVPAGEDTAFAVLHGLYWLTANLAERCPLTLAVDDLHSADAASLRWIAYLVHRLDGLPVLVVATLRPFASDPDPALADLLGDPSTVSIRPSPLTLAAATEIVADRLSVDGPAAIGAACHQATGGNPLLLRELLTALASETLPSEPEAIVGEIQRLAPAVVARRVGLALAKLGREATALAQAVAVLGDGVELREAAAVAGLDDESARGVATRLADAELLSREGTLGFSHPLLRSAVYNAMPAAERGAAHERGAALLAEAGAPIERVAAQLVHAPPAARGWRVETLREAARRSLAEGAPESAAGYLRRALDEPPPPPDRADILLELANAEVHIGTVETTAHLREAVALLTDVGRRALARLELARALFWVAEEEQAAVEIEAALQDARAADPPLRRTLEAEYFAAAVRLPALHEAAHTRLARVEIGNADDPGARMLLALKAYAATFEGENLEDAIALAERALSRGLPSAPTWSFWGAVYALLWADRFEPALRVTDEVLADARRRGVVFLFSAASMVRAMIGYARGTLVDAEADARAALDGLPHRRVLFMPNCFGWLAQVLVERGRPDEAAAILRDAGADAPIPETYVMVPLLRARGILRLARGDPRGAAADALACGRAYAAVGIRNPAVMPWRSEAARALLAAGDATEARRLASEELAHARRWGAPRPIGRALRVLGLTEGGEAGLRSLRDSVLALESSPALLERAHSLVEVGSALRRARKRIEARDRLRAGLDLAQRCGASALATRAHEELIAAGAKPRTAAISGAASLTPSERRIAAMASEGLTNREIAQALFVTPRTVEMHLSNAFRKLRIASRTQLGDALAV